MLKMFIIILWGVFMLSVCSNVSEGDVIDVTVLPQLTADGTPPTTPPILLNGNGIIPNGIPPNGTPPILPPQDPNELIMPIAPIIEPGDPFIFPPIQVEPRRRIWFDPLVAIGYDYKVVGPRFAQVVLPWGIGDNIYSLHLWDPNTAFFSLSASAILVGGILFNFPPGGVDRFRILGIEPEAGLDSTNPIAFPTGLTFTEAGTALVTQTPIPIPEPSALILLSSGLISLVGYKRIRKLSKKV